MIALIILFLAWWLLPEGGFGIVLFILIALPLVAFAAAIGGAQREVDQHARRMRRR